MKKVILLALFCNIPLISLNSTPSQIDGGSSNWSKAITARNVITFSGIVAAGVGFWKGYLRFPQISGQNWKSVLFNKNLVPVLTIAGGLVSFNAFQYIKKSWKINQFIKMLKMKIDNQELTYPWVLENMPVNKNQLNAFAIHFENSTGVEPRERRWELARYPLSPFVQPYDYIGILEMAEMYWTVKEEVYRQEIKKALDKKIDQLKNELYRIN